MNLLCHVTKRRTCADTVLIQSTLNIVSTRPRIRRNRTAFFSSGETTLFRLRHRQLIYVYACVQFRWSRHFAPYPSFRKHFIDRIPTDRWNTRFLFLFGSQTSECHRTVWCFGWFADVAASMGIWFPIMPVRKQPNIIFMYIV